MVFVPEYPYSTARNLLFAHSRGLSTQRARRLPRQPGALHPRQLRTPLLRPASRDRHALLGDSRARVAPDRRLLCPASPLCPVSKLCPASGLCPASTLCPVSKP